MKQKLLFGLALTLGLIISLSSFSSKNTKSVAETNNKIEEISTSSPQQVKKYVTFCQAEHFDNSIYYVSEIFECSMDFKERLDYQNAIKAQWKKKIMSLGVREHDPYGASMWSTGKEGLEIARQKEIQFKKDRGYKIVYVKDFTFDCKK